MKNIYFKINDIIFTNVYYIHIKLYFDMYCEYFLSSMIYFDGISETKSCYDINF